MKDRSNSKVTLILPVRRAGRQVERCLRSICAGTVVPEILVMDCTAEPGALERVKREFPGVRYFDFGMNPGRAHAVNTGIHLARTPYVMTFSPELTAGKHCVEMLCRALDEDRDLMSVQAGILSAEDPARILGAGWSLPLGVVLGADPVVRGNGARAPYGKRAGITAAQMEAAVYRMEHLEVTGILDERYYGRLEDLDLGLRGILCGFRHLYEPRAVCREIGRAIEDAGTEGASKSRFYRQLEIGNMIYFRYKFGLDSRLRSQARAVLGRDEAAVTRGRMLCFQAEMESMERDELGMSVTKQTLPEECCLGMKQNGPDNVYPLFVGERVWGPFEDSTGTIRVGAALLSGTGEKIRSRMRSVRERGSGAGIF